MNHIIRKYLGFTRRLTYNTKYKTTVLNNGITVATEFMPQTQTSTLGVWINAGSRGDDPDSSGTAHFLEHMAFKGTKRRTQYDFEKEIEDIGSLINAYTSRENTVYYSKCLSRDIEQNIEILSDLLSNSLLENNAIENERHVILQESDEVDKMFDEVLFDRLHEVAYKGHDLGRTILGSRDAIKKITRNDLIKYIQKNYRGDRMAFVGVGCVDHANIVTLVDKYFGHFKKSDITSRSLSNRPIFHGQSIKVKMDYLPITHVALAIDGEGWSSPDFFVSSVTNGIIGTWDRSDNFGLNSFSKLGIAASMGGKNSSPLVNSYMAYTTSYSDSGLMGIYFTADKDSNLNKFIIEITKEWSRLKTGCITDKEIEKSKSLLKASLLLSLDDSTSIAEDIGRQVINTGKRLSPQSVFQTIDSVTKDDVVKWANKKFTNASISLSAVGNVKNLPTHDDISKLL